MIIHYPKGSQLKLTLRNGLAAACLIALTGCGGGNFGRDGPSYARIKSMRPAKDNALLVQLDNETVAKLDQVSPRPRFSTAFGSGQPFGAVAGAGDILQLTIYESPPAMLFGTATSYNEYGGSGGRANSLPDIAVNESGTITVPFAGTIRAAGRSPQDIAADIKSRLAGKAHDPQVLVSIVRGAASTVTIVGEVGGSTRMPLTAKGERLLDALATAGGTRQPIDKISLQLSRGGVTAEMPLDQVIADPAQNIYLMPGDVVTAVYQSLSFTALGATGLNTEVKFEAKGIMLSQALGRIGGLRNDRANPRAVFIFRLEDPAALGPRASTIVTPDASGRIPVIYQIDLGNPTTFFVAQKFAMKNGDMLYVSDAPIVDIQKFVNIIGAVVYPIGVVNAF